jgi:hypothetical protein
MSNKISKRPNSLPSLAQESKISQSYKRESSTADPVLGTIAILVSPDRSHRVMAVDRVFYEREEAEVEIERQTARLGLRHRNLVNLLDFAVSETTTLKSTVFGVRAFYELPGVSLKNLLSEAKDSKMADHISDIGWLHQLVSDVADAMNYLKTKKLQHGAINLNTIYFNKENSCFKLNLFNACSDTMNQTHLEAMLKGLTIYVSPQIADAFKSNRTFGIQHNQEKSDVFSLGLVFLRCLLRDKWVSIYDGRGNFRRKEYKKALYSLSVKLERHPKLSAVLKRMLEFKEESRPTIIELNDLLQRSTDIISVNAKASPIPEKARNYSIGPFNQSATFEKIYQSNSTMAPSKDFVRNEIRVSGVVSNQANSSNPFFSKLTEDENRSSLVNFSEVVDRQTQPRLYGSGNNETTKHSANLFGVGHNHVRVIKTQKPFDKGTTGVTSCPSNVQYSASYRSMSPGYTSPLTLTPTQKSPMAFNQTPIREVNSVIDCKDNFFNDAYNDTTTSARKIIAPVSTPIQHKTIPVHTKSFQITPSKFEVANGVPQSPISTPLAQLSYRRPSEFVNTQINTNLAHSQRQVYKNEIVQEPRRRVSVPEGLSSPQPHIYSRTNQIIKHQPTPQKPAETTPDSYPGKLINVRNTGKVKMVNGELFREIIEEFEKESRPDFRSITVRSRFIRAESHSIVSSPLEARSVSPIPPKRNSVCQRYSIIDHSKDSNRPQTFGESSRNVVIDPQVRWIVKDGQTQRASERTIVPSNK